MQDWNDLIRKQLNNLASFPAKGVWKLGEWTYECHVRPEVANAAALPLTGNETGDVRVSLADQAWYIWDGAAWQSMGGGGGGGVSSVSASAPLSSSGGVAPNISLTGVVAAANGGTGLSAPGTLGNILTSTGTGWTSAPAPATGVTSVTASAPLASSGGATPNVSLTGTIPVANGGTGTSTTFTQGSVVFAGPSGVYAQDNANFFWNDTTNRLGLGTSTPAATLGVAGGVSQSGGAVSLTGNAASSFTTTTGALTFDAAAATEVGGTTATAVNLSRVGVTTTVKGALRAEGTIVAQNAADSSTAYQFRNLSGTAILNVDTANQRVGVGTAAPTAALTVVGSVAQSAGLVTLAANGPSSFTTSAGALTLDATTTVEVGGTNATGVNISRSGVTTTVRGNLVVEGTTTTTDSETVLIADNHLYINNGYTTTAAQTGGLVVNYLPTATTTTVAGSYTAGVPGVSNPSVVVASAGVFAAGNIIQIANGTNNEGLYEVLSNATTTMSIRGVGTTPCVEDFTQNQFVTGPSDSANVRRVTVSVMRAGTDGIWETGQGSATPVAFTDIGTGTVTGTGTATQLAYFSGASTLTSEVGTGTDALTWDATNNRLGVATNTPSTTVDIRGTFLARNTADSATAFQVQNAASATVFNVDTTSQRVGIGVSAPSSTLSVGSAATERFRVDGATGRIVEYSDSVPANGEVLIGNGTDFAKSTLTAGTNIAVTNGAGSITVGLTGTVAVANGGTGTSTAFTPGSVVFAGTSGVYTQDNANLFWDDTNNRLGIGTATPNESLTVNGRLSLAEGTAPTSTAGFGKLYALSSDSRPYFMDDGGQAFNLTLDRFNTLTPAASVAIDANPSLPVFNSLAISQNTTFTTANLGNGRSASVRISNATASPYTLNWPVGWTWLGSGAPSSIPANTTGFLSITAYGTADANVVAAWSYSNEPVAVTGTGVDNQIAVWSGTNTQDGSSALTFNGTTLGVTGGITQTGGAVSLTGNAASSLTTSAGNLTLTGGAALLLTAAAGNEVVVNDGSADVDFRVEGDTNTHAIFVQGSDSNVGIGTATPNESLTVNGRLSLAEGTAPTSTAGFGKLYALSSDSRPYFMDDSGQAFNLTLDRFNTLTPAASVAIDTNPSLPVFNSLAISQNTTFTTANLGNGRSASVRISNATASPYTLNWPAGWTWLGSGAPSSIAANTTGYLSITAYGATDANVVAAWSYSGTPSAVTGLGAATRVAFWNGTSSISSNANLFWDNTNARLGVNTATPLTAFDVASGQIALPDGTAAAPAIAFRDDLNCGFFSPATDVIAASAAGTEVMRVFLSGSEPVLALGTATGLANLTVDSVAQVSGAAFVGHGAAGTSFQESYRGGQFAGARTRGTRAAPTQIGADDGLACILGSGYTATATYNHGALITIKAEEAYTSTASGGRIEFHTTTNGTNGNALLGDTTTERMRITNAGIVSVNGAPTATTRFQVISSDATINGLTVGRGNGSAAATSTAVGVSALAVATGANNTAVGNLAADLVTTGTQNTAVGSNALGAAVTTSNSTAIGFNALLLNTVAENTAVGASALAGNTTGVRNVGVGFNSLAVTTSSDNTAVGHSTLAVSTSGNNTAIGAAALASATNGNNNTAVGRQALTANVLGSSNVAVGSGALQANVNASGIVAVGFNALALATNGVGNTAVGDQAAALTAGTNVTAIGSGALANGATGNNCVAVGNRALLNNTANENTALGSFCLDANTTGTANVAVGFDALGLNSTQSNNTAIGHFSQNKSSGANNTSVGAGSLDSNSASNCTAVGYQAAQVNGASLGTTAVGYQALSTNSGDLNTAVGAFALNVNGTGAGNTALGYASLGLNSAGAENVAIGVGAMDSSTTATRNVAVGVNAATNVAAGVAHADSVAVGHNARVGNTSLGQNTVIGSAAGTTITTGTNLTLVGYNAEPSSATATNEITLGDTNVTAFRFGLASTTAPNPGISANLLTTLAELNIGHNGNSASAPFLSFFIAGGNGTGAAITQAAGGGFGVLYTTGSDYRLKQDVETLDVEDALARVNRLRPVKFRYTMQPDGPLVDGFIAHEAQEVVPQAVTHSKDAVKEDDTPRYQGIDHGQLVPVLAAACKALAAKVEAAEARADIAEARADSLEARLAALEALIAAQ